MKHPRRRNRKKRRTGWHFMAPFRPRVRPSAIHVCPRTPAAHFPSIYMHETSACLSYPQRKKETSKKQTHQQNPETETPSLCKSNGEEGDGSGEGPGLEEIHGEVVRNSLVPIKVSAKGWDQINTRATYSLRDDGTVNVPNETWSGGKRASIEGTVNVLNALIGQPSRKYLWILCRVKHLDEEIYKQLVEKAKEEGYVVSKLYKTQHTNSPPGGDQGPKDTKGILWR